RSCDDVAELAEKSRVDAEAQIADARARRRSVGGAAERHPIAGQVGGDGKARRRAEAIGENDTAPNVNEELVAHQGALLGAVRCVENERLVTPVADHAESEAPFSAKVERFEGEPLTAALGWLVAIERKTGRRLSERRRGSGGEEEQRR